MAILTRWAKLRFVQAYAVRRTIIDKMLMWSFLSFPCNQLLSRSCRFTYLQSSVSYLWACGKVTHWISSKDTCIHTLHPFSLHHHMGLLLNQRADFKGCIIVHVSLCGRVTCSQVSLCCTWLCVLWCVFVRRSLFLPSNYWCRKKSFTESSQCDESLGSRPTPHPLPTHTHQYTHINFMSPCWVPLEKRQSAASQ